MFCGKCGKELLADSLFCPSCGVRVKEENYLQNNQSINYNHVSMKENNESHNFLQRKFSKKMIWGLLFGIFIVFLLSMNNLDKRIVGEWESDEYINGMHDWTFYNDGSFRYYEVKGTYVVKGNKLTVHVMSGWVGDYFEEYRVKIQGNRMTLTNLEDGIVTHLTKIN